MDDGGCDDNDNNNDYRVFINMFRSGMIRRLRE